jgi:hypothetical protein
MGLTAVCVADRPRFAATPTVEMNQCFDAVIAFGRVCCVVLHVVSLAKIPDV